MGHTDWGADRIVLLCLYRLLVRSKLDYRCIVYGSACRLILKQLDLIDHQGLRIALGAFHTSPAQSPPLGIHILPHLEKSKLNLNLVDDAPSLDIVPWKLPVPAVRFDLASLKKDTTNPEIYKQLYLQLITEYPFSEKIFTDSSKTEEGVAAVAVSTK